ncbi:hypothetical protein ACFQ8C_32370 [Streptomyces sp. NPDC056503]|uniref:hypothetical protein n=1 Tax=Streptomyces sp. NPDC056503 TaxID=3345842 RepID=UPI0036A971B7
MRSVFASPVAESAAVTARLDGPVPGEEGSWTDGKLSVDLEDERNGLLPQALEAGGGVGPAHRVRGRGWDLIGW